NAGPGASPAKSNPVLVRPGRTQPIDATEPSMADAASFGALALDRGTSTAILSITAASAEQAEGNSGATPFTFIVSRSGDTSTAVRVNWAVAPQMTRSAGGADFTLGDFPSGVITFAE